MASGMWAMHTMVWPSEAGTVQPPRSSCRLHVLVQLLLVVDPFSSSLCRRVVDREDAREGGSRRARIGRLDLALNTGSMRSFQESRLEALLLEELRVRHEDEVFLADGGVIPVLSQLRRDLLDVRRLVRLDDPRLFRGPAKPSPGRAPR